MALKTSNNVKKLVAVPVLSTDLTITLVNVLGLPDISAVGDYTILTFIRLSDLQQEIVRVDDITGNVLTVQRAQEGTVALSLIANDEARNFFTSAMFMETSALANRALAEDAATAAALSETNAATSEGKALDWATEDEDVPVETGPDQFSAFHWAQKALLGALPDATEIAKGAAELATQAETDTGTDDTRIVTPLKLKTRLDAVVGGLANESWIFFTVTGGVPSVVDSNNMAVVRTSKGQYAFTFTVDPPDLKYGTDVMTSGEDANDERHTCYQFATKATTGFTLRVTASGGGLQDPSLMEVTVKRQV